MRDTAAEIAVVLDDENETTLALARFLANSQETGMYGKLPETVSLLKALLSSHTRSVQCGWSILPLCVERLEKQQCDHSQAEYRSRDQPVVWRSPQGFRTNWITRGSNHRTVCL
ncbi:MAG: hypothetical protein EBY29_14960 [Planctomycetes bacterium]|nr:hypothetical protein [Planctomycetota bacterium]